MPKETTGPRTHVATRDGYAGGLVRLGEAVPDGTPVGSWMAKSPLAGTAPVAGSSTTAPGRSYSELMRG